MTTTGISTLADLPLFVAGRFPKEVLLRRCRADGFDAWSSREFFEQVRDLSLGLAAFGLERGDRVALISESRPEWVIVDFAILTAGGVTVPIYPTLPPAQMRYILADSGARVVIVADETQAAKVREVWADIPALCTMVVIDPCDQSAHGDAELTFAAVQARGHQRLISEDGLARSYKAAVAEIRDDELATIIYTSGTTGDPKGVMLTHRAVVVNIVDIDTLVTIQDDEEALSFLPLSHALERAVIFLYLYKGVTVTFAESLETIGRDLVRVSPNIMTGVPRVYEKLHARILESVAQASRLRRAIFSWAMGVGFARTEAELEGRTPSVTVRMQMPLADRLVFKKIRERLGGRLRFVVSGAAPLSTEVAEFLFAVGIPILEGYGLTETAPVLTVNPTGVPRLGTVGRPLPHVELRIAADGEILARGPNLMQGYYGQPAATDEAIKDGWFHTGDIGRLEDGYLTITDRKKDLLVTAGGKNVAPQPIEAELKRHSLVAEAMLVGDRRQFISAVIVPDFAVLAAKLRTSGETDRRTVVQRADVLMFFDGIVEEANASRPRHEQIRKFALLPTEFSVATGELTPTLKVKRRVVGEKWNEVIDALYAPPAV
jgi:long-chain acyl-CoA synthetase